MVTFIEVLDVVSLVTVLGGFFWILVWMTWESFLEAKQPALATLPIRCRTEFLVRTAGKKGFIAIVERPAHQVHGRYCKLKR